MPQNNLNTLERLHKAKVHFVLCKKSKVAITPRWQATRPSLQAVLKHEKAGGMLGFIPGKSALWILDVDNEQDVDAIRAGLGELAAQALTIVKSRRGAHVYFKKSPAKYETGNGR